MTMAAVLCAGGVASLGLAKEAKAVSTFTAALSALDDGAPDKFGVVSTPEPLITGPTSLPVNYTLSLGVSLTAGEDGSIGIGPAGAFDTIPPLAPGALMGVAVDGVLFDFLGQSITAESPFNPGAGETVTRDVFGSGTFDCSTLDDGTCDEFAIVLSFEGTGGLDSYGLTGGLTVEPVPVPAALPIFLSALAGLGLISWRRTGRAA